MSEVGQTKLTRCSAASVGGVFILVGFHLAGVPRSVIVIASGN